MARQWLEKAAAQGNAVAEYNLGVRYDFGRGVPQDYAKAREWYEKAAAQGNALAQNNLGVRYQNGQGIPKDYVRAYMWYSLAVAHSPGDAQRFTANNRDRVAQGMTSAQIAEAQKLVREWKPTGK
jgi:TPR repeat protein